MSVLLGVIVLMAASVATTTMPAMATMINAIALSLALYDTMLSLATEDWRNFACDPTIPGFAKMVRPSGGINTMVIQHFVVAISDIILSYPASYRYKLVMMRVRSPLQFLPGSSITSIFPPTLAYPEFHGT